MLPERPGLEQAGTPWGSGCTFVDYDRDGHLDLFVGHYLEFDLGGRAQARRKQQLQLEGHPGELRAARPAARFAGALSQQRRRNIHECQLRDRE